MTRGGLPALGLSMIAAAHGAAEEDWQSLFDGRTLAGWTVKIRQHAVGENIADTFRVQDDALTVAYDGYAAFDNQFGHIFYQQPYSHYGLRLEYRFVGEQAPGGQGWAFRNSGIMVHAQAPDTMEYDQDFPISIEFQLLGGAGDGRRRPTANMCSPGTNIVYQGRFEATHCIESQAPTFDGDQWVKAEVLVLGSERIAHYINDQQVMEYGDITLGGGAVSGHQADLYRDGEPLASGYIALQSESHPIQFRHIELLNLRGCMDPDAKNYRDYYVADDAAACVY